MPNTVTVRKLTSLVNNLTKSVPDSPVNLDTPIYIRTAEGFVPVDTTGYYLPDGTPAIILEVTKSGYRPGTMCGGTTVL